MLSKNIFNTNVKFKKPSGVTTATIELETYPVKLATEFTPKELKSTEMFNKNSVPTEKSTRFAQLDNPTGLKYTYDGATVRLTWNDVPIPDAVSEQAIRDYFTGNPIYDYWKDQMIADRLAYNEANIGTFGYDIYMTDGTGTRYIGFVTDNSYTHTAPISSGTSFTVKSAYSIFKTNKSSGATVSINTGSQTEPTEPINTAKLTLSLPQCIKESDLINALQSGTNLKYLNGVSIKGENGTDLTSQASTSLSIVCDDGKKNSNCVNEIQSAIQANGQYNAKFVASAKNYADVNQQTVIKNNC